MKACVDIGGTKVAVSLAQGRELHHRRAEPTQTAGPPSALAQQIIRMIGEACADAGITPAQIEAVGVCACGPFVLNQGQIALATPNICGGLAGPARGLPNQWLSAPVEQPLRAAFAQVRVANDAVAALEAERRWGALQGVDHCAYVTWSTGIGVGLCVDGRVLQGKSGNAGHAGHSFTSDDGTALCGCGNLGDVESLVAGNAMPRRFGTDMAALLTAARAGDALALARVDELCRVLGRMLYNLVVTLDLQVIALGGSVFWHHQALLLPRLASHLRQGVRAMTESVELRPAGLGNSVGDYAALALVS